MRTSARHGRRTTWVDRVATDSNQPKLRFADDEGTPHLRVNRAMNARRSDGVHGEETLAAGSESAGRDELWQWRVGDHVVFHSVDIPPSQPLALVDDDGLVTERRRTHVNSAWKDVGVGDRRFRWWRWR